MSAKDKQDRKSAPLPWTVGDELQDLAAMDADGWCVFRVAARFYDGEPRGEDAKRLVERIVLAVNERDKMHRIAVELAKSRDAAWKRAEALENVLKNALAFVEELQNISRFYSERGVPNAKRCSALCADFFRDAKKFIEGSGRTVPPAKDMDKGTQEA